MELDWLQPILPFIAIGFLAQLVDGALGMAFGVITNSMMVGWLGVAPSRASANIHLVECFTTAASGISHIFHGNIDWRLLFRLIIPGIIGGILGASLISNIDGQKAKPFVMAYLAITGIYLIYRAIRFSQKHIERKIKFIEPLGFAGGLLDAAGGGGWGPVVTSNLMAQGGNPAKIIGTVNASEFLLTITISATFIFTIGFSAFTQTTIGLIIGGLLAAPIGARLAKHINPKILLLLVGITIVLTSALNLVNYYLK